MTTTEGAGIRGLQEDAEELRQELTSTFAQVLAGAGWLTLLLLEPGPGFNVWRYLVALSLLAGGLAAHAANARHPWLARTVLLLGPPASLALAVRAMASPAVPYFAVLAVIANSAISPPLGVLAATLNSLSLYACLRPGAPPWSAFLLLWSAAGLQWISTLGRHMLLEWAWSSQQRASRLLAELRERQGRLNRALRAMDEANARLAVANERLSEARRLADEARQARIRFATNVSHELRTPLNVIVGFAEVMHNTPHAYADTVLGPDFLADLGTVYRNAQHLAQLVDDVLDLAQLEAGKFALQPAEADPAAIVREAVETVRNLVTARGLDLEVHLAPDLPRVRVDRTRIKQVLLNLLSNAVRYTDRGSITVTATSDGRQILFSVADTGPGIPEFGHVNTGRRSREKGAGLGLAISKHFVQAHGGRIWVESRQGVGSTFTFTIPAVAEEWLPDLLPGSPRPEAPGRLRERDQVVVLTPSLVAGRVFSRRLEGYRCVCSCDPQQAVRHIAALQPRGVLVDAALGESTIAMVSEAAEAASIRAVPIVVCPMPSQTAAHGLAGVRGYLSKPVTRQDLLDMLRSLGGHIERILVVDDDEDVLRLLRHYLENEVTRPYRVSTAGTGEQALQQMMEEPPDLLLLDLVMPVMDGYELLQRMRTVAALAETPVVIISGHNSTDGPERLEGRLEVRVSGGWSLDQLVRSVNELLRAVQEPAGEQA